MRHEGFHCRLILIFALFGGASLSFGQQGTQGGEWHSYGGDRGGTRYSALDQITADNVGDLRLVWSWALRTGPQQTTPLVHDGVLYIANPGEIVHAINAATGVRLRRLPMNPQAIVKATAG